MNELREYPPPLSVPYHKAHKQYLLYSGLLLAWEVVGVEISFSPESSFRVALRVPGAVPYAIFVLLLYFGLKIVVEWEQCDVERRSFWPSRVDYYGSHVIAALSVSAAAVREIFSNLNITSVQNDLGNTVGVVTPMGVLKFVMFCIPGFLLALVAMGLIGGIFESPEKRPRGSTLLNLSLTAFILVLVCLIEASEIQSTSAIVVGILAGIVTLLIRRVNEST